jgi:hypothetical protein
VINNVEDIEHKILIKGEVAFARALNARTGD